METTKVLTNMPFSTYQNVWQFIQSLEYKNEEGITYVESQIYDMLKELPEDVNLLVLLLHMQIMQGRQERAKSIAYKVWEIGGEANEKIEKMYIDDLLNIGLSDMAGAALAPHIANLETSIFSYEHILLKYAVFSGNMNLLERLLAYLPDGGKYDILRNWLILNDECEATTHIQFIMDRLIEKIKENILGFSYNLFFDREFPEVEFVFYVDDTIKNYESLREQMHLQISSYCSAHKIDDLINLSVVIYPLQRHPRQELWLPNA